MGQIRLKVQTVLAFDPDTLKEHTAYTVILFDDCRLLCVSGWTLRDAIDLFCRWYHIERERVCLLRPFVPQSKLYYE